MKGEQDVNRVVEQYSDMIRRLCMIHLKNYADTEDIGSILNQQQKSASISIHLWSWNLIELIVCSQWKVNDQIQSKEVLNHIKGCTNKSENIYCYYIKAEEVENAHEAGFSCGKYKVFLEIQELDPRITAKEVKKNLKMY